MYIKSKPLLIYLLLFFTVAPLYGMGKKSPEQLRMCKTPSFEDNSGACLLCGLVGCTCICTALSITALFESLPLTAFAWGVPSLISGACLHEIYLGYKDEQKRRLLEQNHKGKYF